MKDKIKIRIDKNYGNEAIYAICDTGQLFLKLTGKKTLRRIDIGIIKKLGYEFEIINNTL